MFSCLQSILLGSLQSVGYQCPFHIVSQKYAPKNGPKNYLKYEFILIVQKTLATRYHCPFHKIVPDDDLSSVPKNDVLLVELYVSLDLIILCLI